MQFRQGMKVITADGNSVGTLARIVIDPKTKQITHVVLLQPSPFPEERTIPIHQIAESSLERIVLNTLAADQ
jgi:sporulation protein YlmC with PRC-barrel domain